MFQRGSTRVLFRLALLDAGIYLLAIIVLYSTRGLTYTALVDGKLQPVHVIPSGAVTAVALASIAIASFFGLYAYCDSMRIAIAGSFLIFYIVLSTELIFSTLAQTVDETYSQDIIDRFGEYIVWILAFYFGSSVVDKAIGTIGGARKDGEPTGEGAGQDRRAEDFEGRKESQQPSSGPTTPAPRGLSALSPRLVRDAPDRKA